MTDKKQKADQLRTLHVPEKPLVLFNAWDAGSAKAIAAGGAKAIATSSSSVANANGFTDGERVSLALAIDNLRRIVSCGRCVSHKALCPPNEIAKHPGRASGHS
jgi:2-methylisocitrate lyase-like PEP mutase family enzyme